MTDNLVYEFLCAYQKRYGCPPKLREIIDVCPKAKHRSTIYYSLNRLVEKGLVKTVQPSGYSRRYEAIAS